MAREASKTIIEIEMFRGLLKRLNICYKYLENKINIVTERDIQMRDKEGRLQQIIPDFGY